MDSFDFGRSFGAALMSFAIFVLVQFALSKIPALRQRYAVSAGIAFCLSLALVLATPAPAETMTITIVLLLAACGWHYWRDKAASRK